MKIRPVVETRHLIPGRMRSADGFEEGLGCQPKLRGSLSGEFDDLSLFGADLDVQLLDVSGLGFRVGPFHFAGGLVGEVGLIELIAERGIALGISGDAVAGDGLLLVTRVGLGIFGLGGVTCATPGSIEMGRGDGRDGDRGSSGG